MAKMSAGPFFLDMIVAVFSPNQGSAQVVDEAFIILLHKQGAHGMIHSSYISRNIFFKTRAIKTGGLVRYPLIPSKAV